MNATNEEQAESQGREFEPHRQQMVLTQVKPASPAWTYLAVRRGPHPLVGCPHWEGVSVYPGRI